MNNNEKPIGVFDSGVGGISVLKELCALMPNENYIYYGDSLNAPYGSKSNEQIFSLTKNAVQKLVDMGVKAIVIACNTATSVAAKIIRSTLDIPIIGIEPAVKPASLSHKGEKIIVMATPVTIKGEKFLELVDLYKNSADICPLPCPQLAEMIEENTPREEIKEYLKKLFEPFKNENINAVVLGCTHYPHIKDVIKNVIGENAEIFDGGKGTAKETKRILEENGILTRKNEKGKIEFITSKNDDKYIEFMKDFFER